VSLRALEELIAERALVVLKAYPLGVHFSWSGVFQPIGVRLFRAHS
jgi:hypothetical protein